MNYLMNNGGAWNTSDFDRWVASLDLRGSPFSTGDQVIERAGVLQGGGLTSWVGTANLRYPNDSFAASITGRYTSASVFDAARGGPDDENYDPTRSNSINYNRFPSAIYMDLYAQKAFGSSGDMSFTLLGSVDNFLNKQPPLYAAIGINSGGNLYDLIGRRFTLGVRVKR